MKTLPPGITIRPLQSQDYERWLVLWNANNQGHENKDVTAQTWARLNDPQGTVHGLGAWIGSDMAGLVHFVTHPVTGHIAPACYMQDLFVDPAYRRRGIGRSLIATLGAVAKERRYARLYWLAERKNEAAQALYKSLGLKLDFTFHIFPL